MIPRKIFLFYLTDTATGKAYYWDGNHNIQTINIIAATDDVSLQKAPGNWMEIELGFTQNDHYFALNRSFATPMELVKEVGEMVRQLVLRGVGTEVPLTLVVFKYNLRPQAGEPAYKLYYKAPLDLQQLDDAPLESLKVNLMEGGISQLLKSYENTQFQIPCDGSIPENEKTNFDGLLLSNTIYYSITPQDYASGESILPMVIIGQDGDSFGVVAGNQSIGAPVSGYYQSSGNCAIYFNLPTTIRIRGSITIYAEDKVLTVFNLFTATSKSQFLSPGTVYTSYTKCLVPFAPSNYPLPAAAPYPPQLKFIGEETHTFDTTVPLDAYEKLFVVYTNNSPHKTQIVSGNIEISFASQAPATRAWGINVFDLFKALVREICVQASINGLNYTFKAESDLLQQFSGIMAMSGDSLRASGDANYQKFFHPADINGHTSFGPVIKTSLRDFFDSLSPILCACMGPRQKVDEIEALFFESLDYRFDSSTVQMELGEVTDLKWRFASKHQFSDLEIGYQPQTYDQNAGKYEYNTTGKWRFPVNSFQKKLQLISKYRTDSYGIERLRSNIGPVTSTTRNDSDNSVFLVSTDRSKFIYDYFKSYFISSITDPGSSLNTNLVMVSNRSNQPIALVRTDGEYFQPNLDQAIFVFNASGYSATESCNITITGTLNSINHDPLLPADTVTLKLWRNGAVLYEETITVAGVNTPININHSFSQLFQFGDCVYITGSTSATGVVQITSCKLTVGTYVSMEGQFIPIEGGVAAKLLSMPTVIPTSVPYDGSSVVYYGYQYFLFNSMAINTEFTVKATVKAYTSGSAGNITVKFYLNGVLQSDTLLIPCQSTQTLHAVTLDFAAPITFALGDVVFMSVSVPNGMNIAFTDFALQFSNTQVKAYSLLRYEYDAITGIPNIAIDSGTGLPSTAIAGAPYNIEPFTPKRMLNRWIKYLNSGFTDKVGGDIAFKGLSKNQYLSTAYSPLAQNISESADVQLLNDGRYFYPIEVSIKTQVPLTFAETLTGAANAHVHCTYLGYDIYFFATDLRQKPALNESQVFKGLLSPKTKLSDILKMNPDGLNYLEMGDNSIFYPVLSGIQLVPENQVQPAQYHTKSRNAFLFAEQIGQWMDQMNYYQPWQIGDPITQQFITRGLDPVTYTVYKCDDSVYKAETNLDTAVSSAISNPYALWNLELDTTDWAPGIYYIKFKAGVGDIAAVLRSEYLHVMTADDCADTVLLEATSSFNTQQTVFDGTPSYTARMRFYGGFNNKFKQKYIGKFYVDQPQDISILNAVPYEITSLLIGGITPVPDYVAKKVLRMLLLDGSKLDGEGFQVNEGAQIEEQFFKGVPMKFQRLEIRPSRNEFGISVNADGIDTDGSIISTLDAEAMGPNANNASGTTTPNIIQIKVND